MNLSQIAMDYAAQLAGRTIAVTEVNLISEDGDITRNWLGSKNNPCFVVVPEEYYLEGGSREVEIQWEGGEALPGQIDANEVIDNIPGPTFRLTEESSQGYTISWPTRLELPPLPTFGRDVCHVLNTWSSRTDYNILADAMADEGRPEWESAVRLMGQRGLHPSSLGDIPWCWRFNDIDNKAMMASFHLSIALFGWASTLASRTEYSQSGWYCHYKTPQDAILALAQAMIHLDVATIRLPKMPSMPWSRP